VDKNDVVHSGSSPVWHPWKDKNGVPLAPTFLHNHKIFSSDGKLLFQVNSHSELCETVARNGLFLLCYDLLDTREFPYLNEFLGTKGVTPFLSKTRGMPAASIRFSKKNGLLVSSQGWCFEGPPDEICTKNILSIFKAFGYQASTPASLSEKLLKLSLPEDFKIHGPSKRVREDVLAAHTGARIDTARSKIFLKNAYEYDKNKAYLFQSRLVPDPFSSPVCCQETPLEEALGYATGLWKIRLIYRRMQGVEPIVWKGARPVDGEILERWLWSEELRDCLVYGYGCERILEGWAWRFLSDFMVHWSDFLWQLFSMSDEEPQQVKDILKSMMVGLPGRFLRRPEKLMLVPFSEKKLGDIPLKLHWHAAEDHVISDWLMRPIPEKNPTALVHIGSYIVMKMRQELYHTMAGIEAAGGTIIASYADSITAVGGERYMEGKIGKGLGMWKGKLFTDVYAEENRLIGVVADPYGWDGKIDVRAPGITLDQRVGLLQQYSKLRSGHAYTM